MKFLYRIRRVKFISRLVNVFAQVVPTHYFRPCYADGGLNRLNLKWGNRNEDSTFEAKSNPEQDGNHSKMWVLMCSTTHFWRFPWFWKFYLVDIGSMTSQEINLYLFKYLSIFVVRLHINKLRMPFLRFKVWTRNVNMVQIRENIFVIGSV